MEYIEFLVEEPSMEAALQILVPKILPGQRFDIHPHQGKLDLLRKLPKLLRGYAHWLPSDWIVVLIDEDRQECRALKSRLEAIAHQAGLETRSRSRHTKGSVFQVVNWLAIEELEAWFFGDIPAIADAYPGVSATVGSRAKFREPDAIPGGTWEALERVLQGAGYHRPGLNKIEAARRIALHVKPERNRSRSFRGFVKALRESGLGR